MTRIQLGVLIALAQSAHAQVVYRSTTDTLVYTSLNTYPRLPSGLRSLVRRTRQR